MRAAVRLILQPLLLSIVLALVVRATLLNIYAVPSPSMSPTLRTGDHIIVTPYRLPFPDTTPARGDVIVFHSPQNPDELMVKRVIGGPGDVVESRNGRVSIRGHALAEPYIVRETITGPIEPQIVPADCFFVMGDNRGDSFDSRSWGTLSRSMVVGRVRMVLWSAEEPGETRPATTSPDRRGGGAGALDRLFMVVH